MLNNQLKKSKTEAMASDFENQNLRSENLELKKKNLSLSNISVASVKLSKSVSTMTEQPSAKMITIPIAEKKKEFKFDLGDGLQKQTTNQALKQKISRLF